MKHSSSTARFELNRLRATAFQHAYFEKDNDASSGSKGDYIFRETDNEGNELVSIMFEMKNEQDHSTHRHKNEDFFKKLDADRRKKNCEYAVLVSLLEPDSELYRSRYCRCVLSLRENVCYSSSVLYSSYQYFA